MEAVATLECSHPYKVTQNGQAYCTSCCENLISFCNDETRFFEDPSASLTSDRKAVKSIRKELDALDLPDTIKDRADRIYATRVGSNTFRSKVRQEVKFSCIYDAYKEMGIFRDPCEIAKLVGVKRRGMSRGVLRCSYLCTGKEPVNNVSLTALHLVPDMLQRNGVQYDSSHLEDIEAIYLHAKERSELMNRSKPQSIAAALVYFYICKTNRERKLTKLEVATNCSISSMTLGKLNTELEQICGEEVEA